MQGAAHIMMTLDIAKLLSQVDKLLSQGYEVKCMRNSLKNLMADILISLGSIRGR